MRRCVLFLLLLWPLRFDLPNLYADRAKQLLPQDPKCPGRTKAWRSFCLKCPEREHPLFEFEDELVDREASAGPCGDRHDRSTFSIFIASTIASVCPASTVSPTCTASELMTPGIGQSVSGVPAPPFGKVHER